MRLSNNTGIYYLLHKYNSVIRVNSKYEKAYKEVIPAARAALIAELSNTYGIKEDSISEYVEITQAAISKYLNGKHSEKIKATMEKIDKAIIKEYAEKIKNQNPQALNKYLCTVCSRLNTFECRFSSTCALCVTRL